MKRAVFLLLLFVTFSISSSSQALQIGDKVPDVVLQHIINYEKPSLRLSDLKKKLVLLDFWGTGCKACIKDFPKMEALQKAFNDEIQIVLVNDESKDSTLRFFERRKNIPRPALPMVTGDSILSSFFPHLFVPLHVWVDGEGVVRYITDSYNATAGNIQKFLEGQAPQLSRKAYVANPHFSSLWEVVQDSARQQQLHSYTLLTPCYSGVVPPRGLKTAAGEGVPNRFSFGCASVPQLLAVAFHEGKLQGPWPENAIHLEVQEPDRFRRPEKDDNAGAWRNQGMFLYEIMVPPGEADQLFYQMRQHLMRYFKIDARMEKRKVKCLVLRQVGKEQKFRTKGGEPASNFWVLTTDSVKYLKNLPFEQFVTKVSNISKGQALPTPFINAVTYEGNIDIALPAEALDSLDLPVLRKALQQYGLDLVEQDWLTDVLVIRDQVHR